MIVHDARHHNSGMHGNINFEKKDGARGGSKAIMVQENPKKGPRLSTVLIQVRPKIIKSPVSITCLVYLTH
jgi:hypothetical protein